MLKIEVQFEEKMGLQRRKPLRSLWWRPCWGWRKPRDWGCVLRSSFKLDGIVTCMHQTLLSAPTHRTQEGTVVRFGDRAWNSGLHSAGLWSPRD